MRPLALIVSVVVSSACAPNPAATPLQQAEHHHELNLPPVGPAVHVTLDGRTTDVVLATVPHQGSLARLVELWRVAFPSEDPAPLQFDLVGSDGFHPASRPKCTRPLTGVEVAAARIDIATHDVSFDDGLNLPGCYRVKAVVSLIAARSGVAPDAGGSSPAPAATASLAPATPEFTSPSGGSAVALPGAWTSCQADSACTFVSLGCCSTTPVTRAHAADAQRVLDNSGRPYCPPKAACGPSSHGTWAGEPGKCRNGICSLP